MRLQTFHSTNATANSAFATITSHKFPAPTRASKEQSARIARRRRVLAAAAERFSRQGYKGTALREIAAATGCAESTIQREFGGKLGLLEEVIRGRGVCDRVPAPGVHAGLGLHEVIGQLTEWEVNRMRMQRESLRTLLPRDSSDPIVTEVAGRLSLAGSSEVLHQCLRQHGVSEVEGQFLACTIQAVGFALGWTGVGDQDQTTFKVKQVAKTLAAGVGSGRG